MFNNNPRNSNIDTPIKYIQYFNEKYKAHSRISMRNTTRDQALLTLLGNLPLISKDINIDEAFVSKAYENFKAILKHYSDLFDKSQNKHKNYEDSLSKEQTATVKALNDTIEEILKDYIPNLPGFYSKLESPHPSNTMAETSRKCYSSHINKLISEEKKTINLAQTQTLGEKFQEYKDPYFYIELVSDIPSNQALGDDFWGKIKEFVLNNDIPKFLKLCNSSHEENRYFIYQEDSLISIKNILDRMLHLEKITTADSSEDQDKLDGYKKSLSQFQSNYIKQKMTARLMKDELAGENELDAIIPLFERKQAHIQELIDLINAPSAPLQVVTAVPMNDEDQGYFDLSAKNPMQALTLTANAVPINSANINSSEMPIAAASIINPDNIDSSEKAYSGYGIPEASAHDLPSAPPLQDENNNQIESSSSANAKDLGARPSEENTKPFLESFYNHFKNGNIKKLDNQSTAKKEIELIIIINDFQEIKTLIENLYDPKEINQDNLAQAYDIFLKLITFYQKLADKKVLGTIFNLIKPLENLIEAVCQSYMIISGFYQPLLKKRLEIKDSLLKNQAKNTLAFSDEEKIIEKHIITNLVKKVRCTDTHIVNTIKILLTKIPDPLLLGAIIIEYYRQHLKSNQDTRLITIIHNNDILQLLNLSYSEKEEVLKLSFVDSSEVENKYKRFNSFSHEMMWVIQMILASKKKEKETKAYQEELKSFNQALLELNQKYSDESKTVKKMVELYPKNQDLNIRQSFLKERINQIQDMMKYNDLGILQENQNPSNLEKSEEKTHPFLEIFYEFYKESNVNNTATFNLEVEISAFQEIEKEIIKLLPAKNIDQALDNFLKFLAFYLEIKTGNHANTRAVKVLEPFIKKILESNLCKENVFKTIKSRCSKNNEAATEKNPITYLNKICDSLASQKITEFQKDIQKDKFDLGDFYWHCSVFFRLFTANDEESRLKIKAKKDCALNLISDDNIDGFFTVFLTILTDTIKTGKTQAQENELKLIAVNIINKILNENKLDTETVSEKIEKWIDDKSLKDELLKIVKDKSPSLSSQNSSQEKTHKEKKITSASKQLTSQAHADQSFFGKNRGRGQNNRFKKNQNILKKNPPKPNK